MGCGASASSQEEHRVVPTSAKICIVGAGPAGLCAARWLVKRGFTHVTIFDPKKTPGGQCATFHADGKAFDMATKYIPTTTAHGFGPHPVFQKMLDEYKVPIAPCPAPAVFNTSTKTLSAVPPALQRFDGAKIVTDMIKGFDVLEDFSKHQTVGLAVDAGLVHKGETLEEWGIRNDLEAFTALCAYLNDAFGAGNAMQQSAAWALSYREHYVSTYLWKIIKKAGQTTDCWDKLKLDILTHFEADKQLKEFLEKDDIDGQWFFPAGYLAFWEALVATDKLDLHLEESVAGLERAANGGWFVKCNRTNGGRSVSSYEFDHVIVAAGPLAYPKFMPKAHPALPLMELAETGPGIETFVLRVASWDASKWGGKDIGGWVIVNDPDNGAARFGTSQSWSLDSRSYAVGKDYPDSDILCTIAYVDDSMSRERKETLLREDMLACGLEVTEILCYDRFHWPTHVPAAAEKADWYGKTEALQGQDNLYYIGEMFFSAGVMSSVDGVEKFLPRFFTPPALN